MPHRRYLSTLVALALTATACGSDSADATSGSQPLVIWVDQLREEALRPFTARFAEEHGVDVDLQTVSNDKETNFITASQAGEGPDLFVGAHDWLGSFIENGTVDPVHLSETQAEQLDPLAQEALERDGALYGVPYAVESTMLVRNTDLVPDAPGSIEELVEQGQELQSAGEVSRSLALPVGQSGDITHIYPLYSSAGGRLLGEQEDSDDFDDLDISGERAVEAFERIRTLGEEGEDALNRSVTLDNNISLFARGQAPFLVTGPWALSTVRQSEIPYEISPVPGFSDGEAARPFISVQAFFVASDGDNKVMAQEFVTDFLLDDTDLSVALYEADPRPPALMEAREAVAEEDPDADAMREAANDGVPLPALPGMSAVWAPLGQAQSAIVGGAPVEETLRGTAEAISSQMD